MRIVILMLFSLAVFGGPVRANEAVNWADRVQSDPCQPKIKKDFAKVIVMMDEPPMGWTFKFLPASCSEIPYGGAAADARFYPVGTVFYVPAPVNALRVVTMHAVARIGRTLFMPDIAREGYLKGVVPLGLASVDQVMEILCLYAPLYRKEPEGDRI